MVVACSDMAGNIQKNTLGYIVYWPEADTPWIDFSGDIEKPEYYNDTPLASKFYDNVKNSFMVYPGIKIKAIAFHAQEIAQVDYKIEKLTVSTETSYSACDRVISDLPVITDLPGNENNPRTLINSSKRSKFDFEFVPEMRSAFYVITATATSASGKTSAEKVGIFQVLDITFPNFIEKKPDAMKPLFMAINNSDKSITISGIVDDATVVDTLCLVWINPGSKNFSAMAQLDYFKDPDYPGWKEALKLTPGTSDSERPNATLYPDTNADGTLKYPYDQGNPNKLWRLNVTKSTDYPNGINPTTKRVEYKFSQKILLSDLNIGTGLNPLKSQVFLLRAANKNPRVTIETYTPQGDETPPVISITKASVTRGSTTVDYTAGQFAEIPKFENGNTITLSGTWTEDSLANLSFNDFLKSNFEITVNEVTIPVANISFTGNTTGGTTGTWSITATAGTTIPLTNLKDTLYASAKLKDFGGNQSESTASWLVQSDTLRLVRISSDDADQSYGVGKQIKIFLEFNKPVLLKDGRSNPVLNLRVGTNTSVTATYIPNTTQSTKQVFSYTVADGQNTTDTYKWLDVIGISGSTDWAAANYPFTWETKTGTVLEEIRVTNNTAHTEGTKGTGALANVLLRRLPVATNPAPSDLTYTLANGKNISIDTSSPTVTSVYTTNKAGHYALNDEIAVNVVFSEAVKIADETKLPVLKLKVKNGSDTTVNTINDTAESVKVNGNTVTFTYKVKTYDTTGNDKVIVDTFTNLETDLSKPAFYGITDIAGNAMTQISLTDPQKTLNGGTANNGSGVFINTIAPSMPTFKALTGNNTTVISNNITSLGNVTGESGATGSNKDLKNYYGDELWFSISNNTTGTNSFDYFEYTLDTSNPPKSWKRIDSNAPFQQNIYGQYSVRVRQFDKAGNESPISGAVTLNWDPGDFIERIDSTTPNGTYTKNDIRNNDKINITVYFRKPITTTGTPQITLNAKNSTFVTVGNPETLNAGKQLSFTYNVDSNDNTPAETGRAQYLDVTELNINARDSVGVDVSNYTKKLPADNDNRLGYRKEILVQTGELALQPTSALLPRNPDYAITQSGDTATGTITVTFNRSVTKNTGNIEIKQIATGYRLPAVLTEDQASRYKNVTDFNKYYTKGTNGFVSSAVDTSAKYVLNYTETARVDPSSTSTGTINKLASDFIDAEGLTLPVSSQAVVIDGNKMIITLNGSNVLQVLGATYDINIPQGIVQDGLSFPSPDISGNSYRFTSPGINRPFVRVDKKINKDKITQNNSGSSTVAYLSADFSDIITTTARLDCRSPDSTVRYKAGGVEHTATGATTSAGRSGDNWRNAGDADTLTYGTAQTVAAASTTGDGVTDYTNFTGSGTATHLTVGNNAESGYIWRIAVRSRNTVTVNGTSQTNNSDQYEEIAFRTVLTYFLNNIGSDDNGKILSDGDQLWLRGGDAISSSSIPGFPLTWDDNYDKLRSEKKRAGVRLLNQVSRTSNNTSTWRYITWEINVKTYHEIMLANGNIDVNEAMQYGPRLWAYARGGWCPLKDVYAMYPGKHRWLTVVNLGNYEGGRINFILINYYRDTTLPVTYNP